LREEKMGGSRRKKYYVEEKNKDIKMKNEE
jgi:hypothetical protein